MNNLTHQIWDLLYSLGVTANYTGFIHTVCAVSLCAEQPERLLLVTKWVYPEVARQCGTSYKAVERNIRTVGDIIWRKNRPMLEELAHMQMDRKPRNAQLLAILLEGVKRKGPQAESSQPEVEYETEEVKQGCSR